MPALQVKDFPPDLYEDLRACAAADDRSMSQQTVHVLRDYLSAWRRIGERPEWEVRAVASESAASCRYTGGEDRETRIERRQKVFEEIDVLPKVEIPTGFPEPASLVHQMREERNSQIVPGLEHTQ